MSSPDNKDICAARYLQLVQIAHQKEQLLDLLEELEDKERSLLFSDDLSVLKDIATSSTTTRSQEKQSE